MSNKKYPKASLRTLNSTELSKTAGGYDGRGVFEGSGWTMSESMSDGQFNDWCYSSGGSVTYDGNRSFCTGNRGRVFGSFYEYY